MARFERLESLSRPDGLSPIEFAQVFLEEGLRMQAHPGIVCRPGPAIRRPALAGGPDIWEVARVLREYLPDEKQGIHGQPGRQPAGRLQPGIRGDLRSGDNGGHSTSHDDEGSDRRSGLRFGCR